VRNTGTRQEGKHIGIAQCYAGNVQKHYGRQLNLYHKNYTMTSLNQLKIQFGKDQEVGADNLLEEMSAEGKVLKIVKTPIKQNDKILYEISFGKAYDCYEFGHRSASLWQYVFGKKAKPQQ
jgi:hypothetical protein